MKMQKLIGLLVVGAACVVMLGAGFFAMPMANAQSGSKVQDGSGSSVQQGSGSSTQQQESATQQGSATKQPGTDGQKSFEEKMWSYIQTARYDQWAPAGDKGDFRESSRPHGAFVKTYMNRVAAGNSAELPHGSIIIKENFSPEKKLMAVTLMHRSKGYNPDANDWYWIKYNPDGTTAMMDTPKGKMKIAGKAKGCIECHSGADGDDYTFFND